MGLIVWGETGTRNFETGVDHGVLYSPFTNYLGVPWNGLTAVNESPTGGDPQAYYLDGIKYLQVSSAEEYHAVIEAYSSPSEFDACDGTYTIYAGLSVTQQPRKQFGFSYRTLIGNDVDRDSHGYKLHIVYNALAKPTARSNVSISTSADPLTLSWDITTVPPLIADVKPSAHLVIDSTKATPEHLAAIEALLYGSVDGDSKLPTVDEILTIFGS